MIAGTRSASWLLSTALLAACGGGSGGGGNGDAPPPPPQTVAFTREIGGQFDLFLIKEDGTSLAPLATTAQHESFAGVAGDGVIFSRFTGTQLIKALKQLRRARYPGTAASGFTPPPSP